MTSLVQVPWQLECWLTPDTLALLGAAGEHAGEQLLIDGADGAWRSYARQSYLYFGYVNHLPGFNTASNPDTGQRNHMRGAAFDLRRTDPAAQAACRAVGLVRDSEESWHWNNPRWASMPIIPTLPTSAAGGGGTPIQEDDMPKYGIGSHADNPSSLVFYGPGIQPLDIPNGTWQTVLTKYADAMNANREPVLTAAQWQLVTEACANQPSPEAIEAISEAVVAEMNDPAKRKFYAAIS